ncbi:hypothetical protein [Rhizobium leguminosarum]|uniref:hypothetical protein n=1 Tax=Rhizobium leguminosarum TaxID=384 RepID=UPI001C929A0D|nr:hypothetical protein [Rhizobium leguminosarum]MBY2932516.1 hypothetical protein [Rhizobium leguminosarum]
MTALGDAIRATATSLNTIATAVDAIPTGGGSGPVIPTGVDCFAGAWPTQILPFPIGYAPNDTVPTAVDLSYYDRKMAHCSNGTIMVIGDSQVQDMVGWKIGPFIETFGVGGESLRRCFNRLGRGGLIHRAGAVVLATGVNELANFAYYNAYTVEQKLNNIAMLHQCLAAQATGKWVIRDILPVDEVPLTANVSSHYAGFNAQIDSANQRIHTAWASSPARVEFASPKALMVDSAGNLADANHIGDGMHLSGGGEDIECASIKAALSLVLA